MNNGGKAEKENTPNEANLQEEEVLRGSLRRGYDLGRRPRAFYSVRAGGGARAPAPGRRSRGFGNCPRPEAQPLTVAPGRGGVLFGEPCFCGFLKLRNFEDFSETFVSIMLSFVCVGF